MKLLKTIEKQIGIPAGAWAGRCHEIASKVWASGLVPEGSKVRYGIWWGPISEGCIFRGRPFTHHGWIELPDGKIFDPTRWVFENVQPYIWVGEDKEGYYDVAGQRLYQLAPCPPVNPEAERYSLDADQRAILGKFIPGLEGDDPDMEQLFWIAHLPVAHLGADAGPVYRTLAAMGLRALVPIDSWNLGIPKEEVA